MFKLGFFFPRNFPKRMENYKTIVISIVAMLFTKLLNDFFLTCVLGQNMSVLGSQLEIDMDPEGEAAIVPRHQV